MELARVEIRNLLNREVALIDAVNALMATEEMQCWQQAERNELLQEEKASVGFVKRIVRDAEGKEFLVAELPE